MTIPHYVRRTTPFRGAGKPVYVAGAAQEEAVARLEYLHENGGGWATIVGPPGIGKSALLLEHARRIRRRGEDVAVLSWGSAGAGEFWPLLADAWRLAASDDPFQMTLQRRLEDHLQGLAAVRRPAWVLLDDVDQLAADVQREIRRLCGASERCGAPLTVVVACRCELDEPGTPADLRFALWEWDAAECGRFVAECCRRANVPDRFTKDGISAIAEISAGVPGNVARLAEWAWLASEAEHEQIGPELVHAVAEEISPTPQQRASYEMSAAYGAW